MKILTLINDKINLKEEDNKINYNSFIEMGYNEGDTTRVSTITKCTFDGKMEHERCVKDGVIYRKDLAERMRGDDKKGMRHGITLREYENPLPIILLDYYDQPDNYEPRELCEKLYNDKRIVTQDWSFGDYIVYKTAYISKTYGLNGSIFKHISDNILGNLSSMKVMGDGDICYYSKMSYFIANKNTGVHYFLSGAHGKVPSGRDEILKLLVDGISQKEKSVSESFISESEINDNPIGNRYVSRVIVANHPIWVKNPEIAEKLSQYVADQNCR